MRTESGKGLEKGYFSKRAVRMTAFFMALAAGVMLSVAMFLDFDPESRMFSYGSVALRAYNVFLFVSVVTLTLACLLFVKKRKNEPAVLPEECIYPPYYRVQPLGQKAVRWCAGAVFFLEGTFMIALTLKGNAGIYASPFVASIRLISAYPLALYFIPEVSDALFPGRNNAHLVFGSVGLLWFITGAISDYFDFSVALSSPYRTLTGLAVILSGLAVVYEIKLRTDEPMPRARLCFLSVASVSCTSVAMGRFTALVSGKFISADDMALTVCLALLSAYFLCGLIFYSEDGTGK